MRAARRARFGEERRERRWLVSTRIKPRSTSLADPKEFAHIRRELGIDPTNLKQLSVAPKRARWRSHE
jgi:hypothetical protein